VLAVALSCREAGRRAGWRVTQASGAAAEGKRGKGAGGRGGGGYGALSRGGASGDAGGASRERERCGAEQQAEQGTAGRSSKRSSGVEGSGSFESRREKGGRGKLTGGVRSSISLGEGEGARGVLPSVGCGGLGRVGRARGLCCAGEGRGSWAGLWAAHMGLGPQGVCGGLGFELNLSGPLKFEFHSTGSHKLKAKQFGFNTKFKKKEIAIKSKDFKYSH
jgi:hypothetical protein